MALKRENYTQMGLCILVYVFSILSLSAQNQACPIWADLEPIADHRTATPTIYSQSVSVPFYDWEELDSSRHSDDQYATVSLPGVNRSEMSMFSKWGHEIPDGSTIHGIKLSIEGHQSGNGKIRDVKVQLQGSNENKAGQYLGVAFPDSIDQVWRYGGANDTWGRNWSSDQINSSSFGLVYQVRNSLSSEATLHIDQISIEIFYTPMYTFCNDEHACVAFGVEEVPGYSYNWNIPIGFERLSSLNEQHTVNIGALATTNFGEYNLCIDIYDWNGDFAENCCRQFRYKDCRPSTIGDQVFLDNDHDNQFSDGDVGVGGVTLYLYDEFDNQIASTITDENGNYQFEETERNYYLQLELPQGLLPVTPNVGGNNVDSDLDNSNGPLTTATFFAAAGAVVDNIDIGLATELIVGDRVWEDKDYNGIQDSLEIGIADVSVHLLSSDGDTLQTTITDANGSYGFDGIRVDDYEIIFETTDSYLITKQDLGADDLDSDINENGSTGIIDFDILEMPFLDLDAGYYRYASIGDYVFYDNNENGIQDAADVPQDSVLITLSTAAGVEIGTVLTDDTGIYLFDSLTPGQYVISAEASELIKPTFAQQGEDPLNDSDLINGNDVYATGVIMLMSNESNNDIDLGWRDNLADLSGRVFEDLKYEGQYDTADVLLPNVTVQLVAMNGTIVQSKITNVDGTYLFMNILPGDYYVSFIVDNDYLFTQSNIGDDAFDSDVTQSIAEGSTDVISIAVGQEILNVDAGVYRTTSIGDYVFLDLNEDGIQNDGDTGLEGIALSLLNISGDEVANFVTEANGAYLFDDLLPGNYTIALSSSDLYLITDAGEGNAATDSDALDDNGQYVSSIITTCSGQEIDTIDFGFVNNYALVNGKLFEDSKADGLLSVGDTLLASVEVMLYDTAGVLVQTSTTDTLGQYEFANVLAGDYYIVYDLSDRYIYTTSDVSGANGVGSTNDFTLAPGQIVDNLLTGAYVSASVGDFVFLDLDENGIQDESDEGLGGVLMELRNGSGDVISSFTSLEDGAYIFGDLVPGSYVINLVKDDLFLPTLSNAGSSESDSDLLEIGGFYTSGLLVLCSGQEVDSIDFGFVNNYAEVNGQVFEDSKADALFNTGDTVIVGTQVVLYDTLNQIVQSTITDSIGNFVFKDVLAGEYYIVYGLASNYVYSTSNVTEVNGEGSTDRFTLNPGEIKSDEITGAYIPGSIGDYVFIDIDEDGIQGVSDLGLQGVELSLLDAAGQEVAATQSDANGNYNFDGLVPGEYTISLVSTDLYLATLSDVGGDELDSDLLGSAGNYTSPVIKICSGQSDDTIDFGFVNNYATITGQVYEDSKADRIFNDLDTALVAVSVTLYNSADQIVQSTVTDVNGNFVFQNIFAGDYYIVYDLGVQYVFSTNNVTGVNGAGSTNTISLAPGEENTDQSTGAYVKASIGDYVFLDANENGLQDEGDTGLSGVILSLVDMSGTVLDMVTTGEDGAYSFDGLVPGNFVISVEVTDFYLPTQLNVGNDTLDSDLEIFMSNYGSSPIAICSGQKEETIDFGFINNYASIGGQVYEDSNADSVFNSVDTTIANVLVTLYNADNSISRTTTTDVSGNYFFDDVIGGNYYIQYGLDTSYVYTSAEVTGVNGIGSTDNFTLSPGEARVENPTGAFRPGSIGDFVFLDNNENGIQDNNADEGLANILLELFNSDGEVVQSINSAVDGSYRFSGLIPGEYSIFVTAPNLYLATLPLVGDADSDSDLLFGSGLLATNVIAIGSGQNDESIDLGFINNYAQISGSIFEDSKANSVFDTPDTLMVGVQVELYKADGLLARSTFTDVDGTYFFDDILAGDYYIVFGLNSDYIYSTLDVSGNNGSGSTDVFTLLPGESITNEPTGAYRNASIGDYIFLDLDDDGLQSEGDTGLQGVQLTLIDAIGVAQGDVISDENGNYLFDNIAPGRYIIQSQFDELYIPTGYQQGDENLDSDLQEVGGFFVSDTITICSGEVFENIDFGLANNYAQLGGVVFADMMRDGQLNATDELLESISVTLFTSNNVEIASTVTNDNGAYLFDKVLAGDYYVVFDLGDRLVTLANVGDDATDSDVTEANGVGSTATITLNPGETNLTVFAGAYELSSIGDFVWSDDNRNGLQDVGELGIAEVVVNLYSNMSTLIAKDTTDENGIYGFEGLTPSMYYIEVEYPQDLTATINAVTDPSLNSDLTDANGEGTTDFFALTSGTDNLDVDAGLGLAGAEIHGEVWLDLDGDETQSASDALLPGIPVKLFDNVSGIEVFSTVTNQNGAYTFKPVNDGSYIVQFQITDTLLYVTPSIGTEATDSDVDDIVTGATGVISVVIGDVILDVDAGVKDGRSKISGQVFIDKNGDGINDAAELNVDTYTVNLHQLDGSIIRSIVSTDGTYEIENVATGDYYLTFSISEDYEFTLADVAADDAVDSDVTGTQEIGSTDIFTLGIQDAQVYDAGVYQFGSIGDFVWFDTDGNGLQDEGEPGVEFANLTIINMGGEAVDIVNTGTDGAYLFDGLAPGRYWIFMQAPLGLKATTYQAGTNSDLDSDLFTDGQFLLSDTIMIMSGQDDLSIDFGFVENPGSIEGFVWNDIDLDGLFNDGFSAFDAITVELYTANDDMLIATKLTDADGGYLFEDISPNEYYIKFVLNENTTFTLANVGADDDIDSDVTGTNGSGTTETFTLNTGQSIVNIYAGLIFPSSIGDLVFLDDNSNGLQDTGEPGIPMIKVILFNASGTKIDSVDTDIQGLYSFVDLDPASYYLEFVYPDAIQPTVALAMMPTLNSDITGSNGEGTTDMIFLGSGVNNEDIDGGFVPTGAVIVGEVWLDTDDNDVQDNPNNPVEGIPVSLYKTNDELIAGPVLTNELGIYGFSSIPTGSYYVKFEIPDSLGFVIANVGPADTDSDVTNLMGLGTTAPFIVVDGELYDNVDAGVEDIRGTINGMLFIDSDADGLKDLNNQGLAGVEVKLFDISGSEVSSTITNAAGSYLFEGLQANSYYIEFSNYPSTYLFTDANVDFDDNVDSDITGTNGVGSSASVILGFDQVITIDGGVYELASVGDYAWIDENNDGIQDPSELPLMGILVEARDAAQTVIGSSTTDDNGMYLISGLVPGTYNLIFTQVDNYIPTIANLGGNESSDSDVNTINSQQAATGTFDLLSGENNLDFDAGYVFSQPSDASISGVVWIDSDGNGIREASNPLSANIGVLLFNSMGVEQASVTTNSDGEYSFTGLADGSYYVLFQNEIGTSPTMPNIGSDLTDSDITQANGGNSTDIINLGPSEVLENVDGGFISVGAIGNQVFVDINGNGRKGSNEPGLNGVVVKLYSATTNMLLETTTSISDVSTMAAGFYQFNDVQLGSYYLVFELPEPYLFTDPDRGTNEELDSDVTAATNGPGSTETFTLASGEVRDDIDAGAFLPAQIGDFVWDDLNGDGIQDIGEPGIPNVAVELKRSNGLSLATTTTDANGIYCFDGLKQGLYFIEFTVPAGFVVSDIYQGGDSALDSDVDATGTTPLVSIAHGSSFKEVDAGFNSQTINNLISQVWFDENGNGTFQEDESPIKDVAISLIDDQGAVMAQTITNHAGKYAFTNIPIGDYQVAVGIDDGFAVTIMNAGDNDWIDSDVDASGMSEMFTVDEGLSVPNVDIGMIEDNGIIPEVVEEDNLINDLEVLENAFLQEESPISFVSGPNPFYNRVQVRMSRLTDGVAYAIYRLDGALIQSGSIVNKDQWIELEQHNDGMYILVVTHNDKPVDKQYLMKVN